MGTGKDMEEEGKKGSLGLWVTRQPLPSKRLAEELGSTGTACGSWLSPDLW